MTNPLFSTYSQQENQVTGTILSVFEHLGTSLVEDILETALDESDLSVVTFQSQYVADESVPDAVVRSSMSLFIETKTRPGEVTRSQLESHLSALENEDTRTKLLVVLTPDESEPAAVQGIDSEHVVWISFDTLVSALEALLTRDEAISTEQTRPPTERETFLIRELIRFIHDTELTSGADERVLVIPARRGWGEYEDYGLYFCQPGRSFRPSAYLAFYRKNEIKEKIPYITGSVDRVELTPEGVERAYENDKLTDSQYDELSETVEQLYEDDSERYGQQQKVLFLDGGRGFTLEQPVINDKTADDSDTRVAFVYNQRYVRSEKLKRSPQKTSELEE